MTNLSPFNFGAKMALCDNFGYIWSLLTAFTPKMAKSCTPRKARKTYSSIDFGVRFKVWMMAD